MIRKIRITGLILFILTLLWVILMIFSTSAIEPGWSPVDYVEWASQPSLSYRLNYINVSVLTLGVVYLFVLLHKLLKKRHQIAALFGLIFIPIYGVMNLIAYSLQITFVPSMAQTALTQPDSIPRVAQWIQANPNSVVGFINGLAYAVLAIPSIIYGYLLVLDRRKYSGVTLIISGLLSIIGILGIILDSKVLSMGIMAGGFLFLLSLGFICFEFRERPDSI